jgi:flavin reductase (DIM6/NTAB) family NADH-FMN oxidoreductase RutF
MRYQDQGPTTVTKRETDDDMKQRIGAALGRVPSGLFILTARYEDQVTGMLASWVQQVSFKPPMVSVAVAKGRPIMPLISESRKFGLCQLPKGEKVILRKFAGGADLGDDPFLGFEMAHDTALNLPVFAHCLGYLECELRCHLDVEGDHDLFVGEIKGGGFNGGEPWIHVRDDGFKY